MNKLEKRQILKSALDEKEISYTGKASLEALEKIAKENSIDILKLYGVEDIKEETETKKDETKKDETKKDDKKTSEKKRKVNKEKETTHEAKVTTENNEPAQNNNAWIYILILVAIIGMMIFFNLKNRDNG